jgi:hypothetical protein
MWLLAISKKMTKVFKKWQKLEKVGQEYLLNKSSPFPSHSCRCWGVLQGVNENWLPWHLLAHVMSALPSVPASHRKDQHTKLPFRLRDATRQLGGWVNLNPKLEVGLIVSLNYGEYLKGDSCNAVQSLAIWWALVQSRAIPCNHDPQKKKRLFFMQSFY